MNRKYKVVGIRRIKSKTGKKCVILNCTYDDKNVEGVAVKEIFCLEEVCDVHLYLDCLIEVFYNENGFCIEVRVVG